MENFIVSARKYRPITFESVVGQQHITNTLKNAIKNNQLAQAFLFCGPRGVGKTTCARILAKTINCENLSPKIEACGVCNSCKSFQNGNSFSIHELDAASNNSVEDIRSLIEQVRIPPQTGKYKIYIIDEVHMLSQSAFNAFLKTLEEPPSYAIFILATTEKHKILPTILSRCQIFDFNRILVDDMAKHLASIADRENITYDQDGLHLIAQKADGGLRDALSMFDQIVSFSNRNVNYQAVIDNLNILDYDYYFKLTTYLLAADTASALLLFNEVLNNGFDGNHFITGLAAHFRNLLVGKDAATITLLEVSENIKQKYLEQSKAASTGFLISGLNITNQVDLQYKQSKNQRLQVELAIIKLSHLNHVLKISTLPQEQSSANELKKKPENAVNQNNLSKTTSKSQVSQPDVLASVDDKPSETASKSEVSQPDVLASADDKPSETASKSQVSQPDVLASADKKLSETASKSQVSDQDEQYVETDKPSALSQKTIPNLPSENSSAEAKKEPLKAGFSPLNSGGIIIPDLNDPSSIKVKKDEEEEPAYLSGNDKQNFSQDDLLKSWTNYAFELKKKHKMSLYSILSNYTPVLKDQFLIELTLNSKSQDDEITRDKIDLMNYLRTSLKNFSIQLHTKVEEGVVKQRPYTNTEKYQYMVEKNPALENFKKKLNLDLEN